MNDMNKLSLNRYIYLIHILKFPGIEPRIYFIIIMMMMMKSTCDLKNYF